MEYLHCMDILSGSILDKRTYLRMLSAVSFSAQYRYIGCFQHYNLEQMFQIKSIYTNYIHLFTFSCICVFIYSFIQIFRSLDIQIFRYAYFCVFIYSHSYIQLDNYVLNNLYTNILTYPYSYLIPYTHTYSDIHINHYTTIHLNSQPHPPVSEVAKYTHILI